MSLPLTDPALAVVDENAARPTNDIAAMNPRALAAANVIEPKRTMFDVIFIVIPPKLSGLLQLRIFASRRPSWRDACPIRDFVSSAT